MAVSAYEIQAAAPRREDPRAKMKDRQIIHTKGWQAASIDDNMALDKGAFVPLTEFEESAVILNCYPEGHHDEMHAHPKEEHVFLVYEGQLHLTGVEDGEEVTLTKGQFVHIDNGYYYRLHNPGPGPAVYCQFRTVPKVQPKRRIVFYEESARGKRALAAQKAAEAKGTK
jgi:mannose-6-phosphate isomerase-like protein (cupin superfamily)